MLEGGMLEKGEGKKSNPALLKSNSVLGMLGKIPKLARLG